MKLLISSPAFYKPQMQEILEYAKKASDEIVLNPYGRLLRKEEIFELWNDVDGIIAGVESYSADILAQAPEKLKVISRYGVGFETVDALAAASRGIKVTNTPGVNSDAVADMAIGLMISIARKIPQYNAAMLSGNWQQFIGTGLNGKTLGIVGLGAIGKQVAKRAKGFSMKLIAYDPFFDKDFAAELGIEQKDLGTIYKEADFLTLHLPVTSDTEGMIDAAVFDQMRKSSFLINTARGTLINQADLLFALQEEQIAGAALDVFEKEPLTESPLFELENVVVTPHLGGHTKEAGFMMGKACIDNAVAVIEGRKCSSAVN